MVIGVLTGLFFSNAEGISLLPFPDDAVTSASTAEIPNNFEVTDRYNPAVKASRSSVNQTGKIKRSDISPVAAGVVSVDLAHTFSVTAADISFRYNYFANSIRENHIVPRGPPAV